MKISVLMSVYQRDHPEHLCEALRSLACQTTPADEIVLVEDGPLTPELDAVIAEHSSSLPITTIKLAENRGLAVALNAGLARCRHELIARMDADDISLPERFEKQALCFSADPKLDVVGGQAIEIDSQGNRGIERLVPRDHQAVMAALWMCPFIHPSIMIRAARLRAIGGYDGNLRRRQDYELWFRCAQNGFRFANLHTPILLYRFSDATLRRQSLSSAWEQGIIGFRGSRSVGLALWKQIACFVPALRSALPTALNRTVYRFMHRLRSRR